GLCRVAGLRALARPLSPAADRPDFFWHLPQSRPGPFPACQLQRLAPGHTTLLGTPPHRPESVGRLEPLLDPAPSEVGPAWVSRRRRSCSGRSNDARTISDCSGVGRAWGRGRPASAPGEGTGSAGSRVG